MRWTPSHTNRWSRPKYQALSPLATYLYEYLQSNPYSTLSGIYPLNLGMAALDTRLTVTQIKALLAELQTVHERAGSETPMIKFEAGIVWVVGQWEHGVNPSPTWIRSLGSEFIQSQNLPFWGEFFATYPHLEKALLHNRAKFRRKEEFVRALQIASSRKSMKNNAKCGATPSATPSAGGSPSKWLPAIIERREEEEESTLTGTLSSSLLSTPEVTTSSEKIAPPNGDGLASVGPPAPDGCKEQVGNKTQDNSEALSLAKDKFGWGKIPDDDKPKIPENPPKEPPPKLDEKKRREELRAQAEAIKASEAGDDLDKYLNPKGTNNAQKAQETQNDPQTNRTALACQTGDANPSRSDNHPG